MSEGWNIAVLGATGAVGEALIETLAERQFPVGEIYALARNESAGEHLRFGGKTITVQDAADFDWTQAQLAFFVAGKEATAAWVEEATNAGCLVIDSSGLFALEPDVPLVVPDVNPFVLADYRNRNVIAVPDSLTSQLLAALKPLIDQGGLSRISVTSLISASAQGKKAVDALAGQSAKLLNGIPIDEDDFFGRQLAFNMLPLLPDREGNVREERRIVDEVRKIMQDEGLMISASVVQAPVFYGHAQMVNFEALRPLAAEEARDAFSQSEDIVLSEENEFPTQVGDASGSPHLSVGCVRNDYGMPEQIQFWSVADQQQPPVYKIALGIEYDGSRYYGWQRQNEVRSVQEKLEKALSQVANEPITVFCAGRTDAGVHGTGQVVHFETTALRKDAAWTLGVNANLPGDIAVRWVKAVPDDFHARFSATARRYRYIIYNHRLRPAVLSKGVTHFYEPLDAERMHRAAQCLLGENDFTSFRAVQCQSRTPWRNVMHINVTRHGPYVVVDIKANAFVHHMVRNIVGSLMEVGAHNQPESWIAELLAAKDRTLAAATAKAEGLYLVAVDYPDRFDLPKPPMGPLFLAD